MEGTIQSVHAQDTVHPNQQTMSNLNCRTANLRQKQLSPGNRGLELSQFALFDELTQHLPLIIEMIAPLA